MNYLFSRGEGTQAGTARADSRSVGTAARDRIRIFVCDGRHCRASHGGQTLIDALRCEIAASGVDGIDVVPCACLDQCRRGPAAVAYRGRAAHSLRPPHGFPAELLHRPVATFFHLAPSDARRMINALNNAQEGAEPDQP